MDTFLTDKRRWTRSDVAALLTSTTALTELGQEDAMKVVDLMHARRIKSGTVLVREGVSDADYMVLILQGEAVVENELANHADSMVLNVLGAGSLIGELGILDGKPRSASCTAVTDMDLAVLERDGLAELIRREPAIGAALLGAILRRVADRLRQTNRKLLALTQINRSLHQELDAYRTEQDSRFDTAQAGNCVDFELPDSTGVARPTYRASR